MAFLVSQEAAVVIGHPPCELEKIPIIDLASAKE